MDDVMFAYFALAVMTIGDGPVKGSAQAVKVSDAHLAHTVQVAGASADAALRQLDKVLRGAGSNLNQVVKINVAVASDEETPAVELAFQKRFRGKDKPAVSLVSGTLAHGARVAMDAVAVTPRVRPRSREVGVLPAGARLYVSGQAVGGTLEQATRETLDKLKANLVWAGVGLDKVVQVKSFVDPMTSVADVRRSIDAYFGAQPPPQVFIEWTSKGRIEIELIASLDEKPALPVEHLWPPDEKPSPVFCRMTRVTSPTSIYVSGLFGQPSVDGERQIRTIFSELRSVLSATGSDLLHLVKATYYVTDDVTSRKLNEIRPEFYDPKHPPAASKAGVRGTGKQNRSVTLDMIAVPVR
jgi:enamine deaminase RidA (YjgF/YER057c/UK114 family)